MKAYVLHGVGDLRFEECPVPELEANWALVKVKAAGICSSDIPRIFEKGTYRFPTIPGHEFCGVVEKVSSTEDSGLVGKRVGVFPLIPCKKCDSCMSGTYETCADYDYLGSRRDGGFAEYAAVPVWNLLPLPDTISDIEAAMLEPAAVARHAVKRFGDLRGKRVCVVGSGPIGVLAGQWARAFSAEEVVIQGRSPQKRELIQKLGLVYTVKAARGFDCLLEAVGAPEAIAESLSLVKPGGTVVLMGNPRGDIALTQNDYWGILRKQISVFGTWNSAFRSPEDDWAQTLKAICEGKISLAPLISHLLGFEDLEKGLRLMRRREEPFCKVLISSDQ